MSRAVLLVPVSILFFVAQARAQNFVYTNNDINGPNSVSAFSVDANGSLAPVVGSPFQTGGSGSNPGLVASTHIVVSGNLLFATNIGNASITVFTINPATGGLTKVPGSPFSTGAGPGDMSIAVTPGNKFLFSANTGSLNIIGFSIGEDGTLAPVPDPALAIGQLVIGLKASPDGRFLVATMPLAPTGAVAVLSISDTGGLSQVPGSPFAVKPNDAGGRVAGVDIDCASNILFIGEATTGRPIVDILSLAPNGTLTPIVGFPPISGFGENSNAVLLDADDKNLYVSNQGSGSTTAFNVDKSGVLSLISGLPFAAGNGRPAGMAINQTGAFLFTANTTPNSINVSAIDPDGSLAAVPGSPFATGQPGSLSSIAAFPPKTCPPPTDLALNMIASPNPVRAGSQITYTITLSNGSGEGQSIAVVDKLPPSLAFVSCEATEGGVCEGTGNDRTITFASLAAQTNALITIVATVNENLPKGAVIDNSATVSSQNPDINHANDSASASATADNPLPRITAASVSKPKLFVVGEHFEKHAVIVLDGIDQRTKNDPASPSTNLIGKKAGKKIGSGQIVKLRVRNADGGLSEEFVFMQP
jgi:uncharacterized repeat protein (TIGR01451 family)